MVGMSADEFWYADPELYYNYARIYESKMKERQQEIWTVGARVVQAISSSVFIAGLADKKMIKQMPNYPECPYVDEKNPDEYTELEKEYLRQKFIASITNWVNSFK